MLPETDYLPADHDRWRTELERIRTSGEGAKALIEVPKQAERRAFLVRCADYQVDEPPLMVLTFTDITEVERVKALLEEKTDLLAQSNSDLQQFAYVASHDLQEPLRMVSSYIQLVERKYQGKLDDEAQEYIAFAVDGARRMRDLINDLLQYSRVATHGKPLQAVELRRPVGRALAHLQTVIDETGARIEIADLPAAMGDESQLTRLFLNLVGNALKYRRPDAAPEVAVGAASDGNGWVTVSIADNGIGIDPQHGERIFQIFQRLHRRESYPGTGIGLAECKKIVSRHGGHIWVESDGANGSVFRFTLSAPE